MQKKYQTLHEISLRATRTEQNPIHRPLSSRPRKRSLSRRGRRSLMSRQDGFDRSSLPDKRGRAEEVIMRSSGLTDRLWCHLAGWRFLLGMRLVPYLGRNESVPRVSGRPSARPLTGHRAVTSFSTPQKTPSVRRFTTSSVCLRCKFKRKPLCVD